MALDQEFVRVIPLDPHDMRFDQCGNAQAVVNEAQIIIAADVTPEANDKRQVVPMTGGMVHACVAMPDTV